MNCYWLLTRAILKWIHNIHNINFVKKEVTAKISPMAQSYPYSKLIGSNYEWWPSNINSKHHFIFIRFHKKQSYKEKLRNWKSKQKATVTGTLFIFTKSYQSKTVTNKNWKKKSIITKYIVWQFLKYITKIR